MTVADDARASLERLIVDRQAVIDDRDAVQTDLDSALAAGFALRAQLDRLQQEFDAYKAAHPDTGPPPPPDPPPSGVRWGMSAPAAEWSARASEVGSGLEARRIFLDLDAVPNTSLVGQALVDGLMPVVSLATIDWSGALAGRYDARIKAWADALQRATEDHAGEIRATVKHEPSGDGDEVVWGRMLTRCLPLLKRPRVDVGPIDNGFKWSPKPGVNKGWDDAKQRTVYTLALLAVCDFLACDTYHGGPADGSGENAVPKIQGFAAWSTRIGWTGRLGLGEWNGIRADDIAAAGVAIKADPRFEFACVFNSNRNNREGIEWRLTGDRLAAFRALLG